MPVKKNLPVFIYWVAVLAGCLVSELNIPIADYFIKPLLMPLLLIWMALEIPSGKRPGAIFAGLFFSWLGDIFLMFDKTYPLCFILGLASFLLTHILYTTWFFSRQKTMATNSKRWYFAIPVFGYATLLVALLYPDLGSLKVPVMLYAFVISLMLISTIVFPYVKHTRLFLISGAIWFVVSDSLLAINKFSFPVPLASAMIRISYAVAQFLIIGAIIRYRNNSSVVNLGT